MLTLLLGFAAITRGQGWEAIFTLPPPAEDERSTILLPPFPPHTAGLAIWTTIATPPVVIGDVHVVTVDIGTGPQLFRLSKPWTNERRALRGPNARGVGH